MMISSSKPTNVSLKKLMASSSEHMIFSSQGSYMKSNSLNWELCCFVRLMKEKLSLKSSTVFFCLVSTLSSLSKDDTSHS